MRHPIDVEVAIAAFWAANTTLAATVLRFGRAAEADVLPYAIMNTSPGPGGRRGRAPERSVATEYVTQRIDLKVYSVGEYECGLLSKAILDELRDAEISGLLQFRVTDDGHPIEEQDRVWFWISRLEAEYARSR